MGRDLVLGEVLAGVLHWEHLDVELVSSCTFVDRGQRLRIPERSARSQSAEGVAIAFLRLGFALGVASRVLDTVIDSGPETSWLFEADRFEDRAPRLSIVVIIAPRVGGLGRLSVRLVVEVLLVELIDKVLIRSAMDIALNLADVSVERQLALESACALGELSVVAIAARRDTLHTVFHALVCHSDVCLRRVEAVLQRLDVRHRRDEATALSLLSVVSLLEADNSCPLLLVGGALGFVTGEEGLVGLAVLLKVLLVHP